MMCKNIHKMNKEIPSKDTSSKMANSFEGHLLLT